MSLDNYVEFKEAYKLLNVTSYMFSRILEENELEGKIFIESKRKNYIGKSALEELLFLQKKFWNEHYILSFSQKNIGEKLYKIESVKIPCYAKTLLFTALKGNTNFNIAFRKKDIDYIACLYKKTKKSDYYISEDEFKEILGLSQKVFANFIKEYELEFILKDTVKKKYFFQEDVEFFKEQQNQLGDKYITTSMAKEKYGNNVVDILWHRCKSGFELPIFCRNRNIKINSQEKVYDSDEVKFYVNKKNFNNTLYNTFGATDFETVKLKLNLYSDRLSIFENTIYTKEKWYEFISEKLSQSKNNSDESKDGMISMLVRATLDLEDLMAISNVSEIYSASTIQINMWLKKVNNRRKKFYLYQFFVEVSKDIKLRLKHEKIVRKGFKIEQIEKPDLNSHKRNAQSKEDSENIYDSDTYIKIFKHLINIQLHAKRAIEYIKRNNGDVGYLSIWLYTLLHLNNGWRHGDVTKFPRLYFKDVMDEYNINDINWFKTNTISDARSRRIISRIIQYDFRISKTEVYGHFFCSNKLAPAIATAILMLECLYQHNYIDMVPKLNEPIMKFAMSKYNEPTETLLRDCFKNCKIPNFKFSSLKMNRSVLTLVYNTACAISPSGYNALILPKYLRAHIEDMSTIQYVQFTSKQLEFLSGELFERGEFGFITDSLLNLISDKPEKSIDRTEDIKKVDELLGDKQKQEAIVGMLNYFRNEKEEIIKLLNEMSYDKCVEIISNIYMHNLPSREIDIQCLFSKQGCQRIGIECKDCEYKIPNIYVLKTLCDTLKEEMDLYINTQHIGKKIKLSSKIHKKVDILMDAIDKFGHEYVYNCIDMNRDEFKNLFVRILEVKDLIRLI